MKNKVLELNCQLLDIPYMDELLNLTDDYLDDIDNGVTYKNLKGFINAHLVNKIYLAWSKTDWNPFGEWNLFQMYRFTDDVAEFHLVYRSDRTYLYTRASDVMVCFQENFGHFLNQNMIFDAQYVDIEIN